MQVVNKYWTEWQIIRVKARAIKDSKAKVDFVLDWFESKKSYQNLERVKNWVKMTSYAYDDRDYFNTALIKLNNLKFDKVLDENDNFDEFELDDLIMVFNDLKKRKYGFQYKNVPKSHTEYMISLEAYLGDSIKKK